MSTCSTREAAKRLGMSGVALGRLMKTGKVPPPAQSITVGNRNIHAWTEMDIERVRQVLPRLADGRTTRHWKKQLAIAKAKTNITNKPQPRATVPHQKSPNQK